MKKSKLNNKRYNTLKSDLDPILIKVDASREARLNGKRYIVEQIKEIDSGSEL